MVSSIGSSLVATSKDPAVRRKKMRTRTGVRTATRMNGQKAPTANAQRVPKVCVLRERLGEDASEPDEEVPTGGAMMVRSRRAVTL